MKNLRCVFFVKLNIFSKENKTFNVRLQNDVFRLCFCRIIKNKCINSFDPKNKFLETYFGSSYYYLLTIINDWFWSAYFWSCASGTDHESARRMKKSTENQFVVTVEKIWISKKNTDQWSFFFHKY